MNLTDQLNQRRQRFAQFNQRIQQGLIQSPEQKLRYPCPCCGYPTRPEDCFFDICELCNWQNDGQDDADADRVLGGPNSDYSLTEARHNFQAHEVILCNLW